MNKDLLDELFNCFVVAEYATLQAYLASDATKKITYKQAELVMNMVDRINKKRIEVDALKVSTDVGLTRDDIESKAMAEYAEQLYNEQGRQ